MNSPTTITQKLRDKSESEIKTQIKEYLESLGWLVVFLVISNKDGYPDIIAAHDNGRTLWIETKAKNKTPNPLQQFRHEQLRKKKHAVLVVTSLQEVKDFIELK